MAKRLVKSRDIQQEKDNKTKGRHEPLASGPMSDFTYAKTLLESKDYPGAITLLEDALSDNPTHDAATLLLAQAYDAAETGQKLSSFFFGLSAGDIGLTMQIFKNLVKVKKADQAKGLLLLAAENEELDGEKFSRAIQILRREGELEHLLDIVKAAHERRLLNKRQYGDLITRMGRRRRPDDAAEIFRMGMEAGDGVARLRQAMFIAYVKCGRDADALRLLDIMASHSKNPFSVDKWAIKTCSGIKRKDLIDAISARMQGGHRVFSSVSDEHAVSGSERQGDEKGPSNENNSDAMMISPAVRFRKLLKGKKAAEACEIIIEEAQAGRADQQTLANAINFFSTSGNTNQALEVLKTAHELSLAGKKQYTKMISRLMSEKRFDDAEEVFIMGLQGPDDKRQFHEAMFKGYARNGMNGEALMALDKMAGDAAHRSKIYAWALHTSISMGKEEFAMEISIKALESGMDGPKLIKAINGLHSSLCDRGQMDEGERLYGALESAGKLWRNRNHFMIKGYCAAGDTNKALNHLSLSAESRALDVAACTILIKALGRERRFDDAKSVYEKAKSLGLADKRLYMTMMSVSTRSGRSRAAKKVFEDAKREGQVDGVTYSSAIKTRVMKGDMEGAKKLLGQSELEGHADEFSYSAMIAGYFRSGNIEEASRTFEKAAQSGKVDATLIRQMVDGYSRIGLHEVAEAVLEKALLLGIRDSRILVPLIQYYKESGMEKEAESLFDRMKSEGISSGAIKDIMIGVYGAMGQMKEATRLFHKRTCRPSKVDASPYNAMIRVYIKAGMVKEANQVLKIACREGKTDDETERLMGNKAN